MMNFFDKHNIICKHQFHFQKEKSVEHAKADIYICIIKFPVRKDNAKAFGTVNHEILYSKLGYYAIGGIPLKLMKSYLSEEKNISEFT